jgi:hypothetical protein
MIGQGLGLILFSADIPRDPKGDPPLPTGETTSRSAEARIEGAAGKGKTVEGSSPQQPVPRKRGRPRKNKNVEEAQAPNEPRTQSVAEKLLMCVVRLEPIEGSSWESCERWRRLGTESMDVRESSQQLKQVQLAIFELYQENRELRKKLAERNVENISVAESRRECELAQETAQRSARCDHSAVRGTEDVRGENHGALQRMWTGHGKRLCGSASAQMKLKGNAVLRRQVKNMKRRNWSLRKMLRVSRLQMRPET